MAVAPLAAAIRDVLQGQVERLGFADGEIRISDPAVAAYRLERDSATGENSLLGEWRDQRGQKLGSLVFHAGGSFFVEHDVFRNHPRRLGWFVESVDAWGSGGEIRAEPRLIPLPV
jgi:hypothetical protein